MNELSLYNKAKTALAECRTTDEVKDIRDKAMAIRLYASQASDRSLEADAIEIRLRAERRLGELMREQEKAEGGANYYQPGFENTRLPSLDAAGIDKSLAHRARTLSRMSEEEFEALIKERRADLSIKLKPSDQLRSQMPPLFLKDDLDNIIHIIKSLRREVHRHSPDKLKELCDACSELISTVEAQASERGNVSWLSGKR